MCIVLLPPAVNAIAFIKYIIIIIIVIIIIIILPWFAQCTSCGVEYLL